MTVNPRAQGSVLDGHKLVVQLSQRKTAEPAAANGAAAAAGSKGSGTKLVVRNVAFEGTRKDVLGLFSPFGAVRSCRLPRKFDGSHRWAPCVWPDFLCNSHASLSYAC